MTRDLLALEDVAVAPPGHAAVLNGISLALKPGACIAIIGASGAGKTTLLRTIAGQLPPVAGRIVVDGVERPTGPIPRAMRRRIAMIPQRHDLVEPLRVHHNVMAGALGRWSNARALRYLLWPSQAELAEAREALDRVGVGDKLRLPTRALSGGEQQRVAIARGLVQAPALMLADEPVAALDPANAIAVMDLLTGLARESGMGLICSLHQPDLAARTCDRVLVARDGRLTDAA